MINKKRVGKKGVSVVIGYVLLISLAVVMSGLLYVWMKSYVPKDVVQCPEGVSISVKDYFYNCATNILNLTLSNNGRYDFAGYYIHGANSSTLNLATIDLSSYVSINPNTTNFSNAVLVSQGNNNSFSPSHEVNNLFNLPVQLGTISKIELTPVRWQRADNRLRFVSCGADAKTSIDVRCT